MVLYHLEHSFGVLVLCTVVSSVLMGVMTVQMYLYCARFWKDDQKYLKWMVVILCILDVLHQAFCLGTMYTYLISHFFHVRYLALSKWPVTVTVMIETVLACLVQFFFARRVFLFNPKKLWLTAIVIFMSLLQLGFGSWSAATTKIDKTFDQYINPKRDWYLATLWTGSSAICDLLITFGIIRGLQKSRTGFKTTDRGITNLMTFTFSTGAISSGLAVSTVIVFLCSLGAYCLGFSWILCRVYSNSLLASLNQRGTWFSNIVNSDTESAFISSTLEERRRGKMSAGLAHQSSSQDPSTRVADSPVIRPASSIPHEETTPRQMEEALPSGSGSHVPLAKSRFIPSIDGADEETQASGPSSSLRATSSSLHASP